MQALTSMKYVQEFKKSFEAGITGIVHAAEIYVKAIDENPNHKHDFIEQCSDFIPSSAWSGFEAVGRKWMHPKLLMGGGGQYAAKIKKLAYSDQEAVFDGRKFDFLTPKGEILKVDVREIDQKQAEQLFDGTRIRPVAAQKAYIESRPAPSQVSEVMPYVITDGKVAFRRGVTLTKQEIRRILTEL